MGGMLTSISDLSRYVSAFLDAWPPRDGAETGPVRRSSLREMQQPWRPSAMRVVLDKSTSAAPDGDGYGFGLGVTQTCQFRAIVAHSGGLPGYGSLMRWLPDYGVGIIAFGNLTYTGWGNTVGAAFDRLERTGGLAACRHAVGRARRRARRRLEARRAVGRRAGGQRRRDEPVPRSIEGPAPEGDRRPAGRGRHLRGAGAFDVVENALRGQWTMSCERGALQVSITLAPTMPPRVQYLAVRRAPAQPAESGPCVSF